PALFGLGVGCDGPPPAEAVPLACDDLSALGPADVRSREGFAYAFPSRAEGRSCANCCFFQADEEGGCGACSLVKGPIHPGAHCSLWSSGAGG
ncbi:MAG: high-potential iron-sulfur protein, partial [Myxococcota bacterium]